MDKRTKREREEDEAMSEREQGTSPTDAVHTLSPNAHTFVMCDLAQHKNLRFLVL